MDTHQSPIQEFQRINITLNPNKVIQAKALQKEISGAINLSGLIDKLLDQWIVATANFNNLSIQPDNTFKKLNNGDVPMKDVPQ